MKPTFRGPSDISDDGDRDGPRNVGFIQTPNTTLLIAREDFTETLWMCA